MTSFEYFTRNIGFNEYPFSTYTTENERGKENELFIPPSDYSPIIQGFNQGLSTILIGNRGTGKTAILLDFERNLNRENSIFCTVDDFSSLPKSFKEIEFYKFLISKISITLFEVLVTETKRLKKLDQADKVLLSYLLKFFVPSVSKRLLKEKIEKLQLSSFKRLGRRTFNYFRGVLNWGATVGVNVVDQYIATHFKGLPSLESEVSIKDFFPELPLKVDETFNDLEVGFQLLNEVLNLISKLGYERTVILFDKLDEDNRFSDNGEEIANFVKPILTDNKLLLAESLQLVVSMWSIPFTYLREYVRTQKHFCPQLNWHKSDLERVLNKRLQIYSKGEISNYKSIFTDDFNTDWENKIFELANNNPRDLWHIFDKMMRNQYMINPSSSKIEVSSLNSSFEDFVTNFNYFEYYPRKNNARANTMDFYSYTAHLLKLNNTTFTRNQLNEQAKTGGSTQNYVVGMERIGLVEKISQDGGASRYRIKDPKVKYALENNIKIEK
ncbi:hypothetical protein ABKJ26_15125 [Exiguobacterium mexicanum]